MATNRGDNSRRTLAISMAKRWQPFNRGLINLQFFSSINLGHGLLATL